jgi:hypothetical protein
MTVAMRDAWTDEKLDHLNEKVDGGFVRIDQRMNQEFSRIDQGLDREFGQMDQRMGRIEAGLDKLNDGPFAFHRTMLLGMFGLLGVTIAAVVTAVVAT